MPQGPDDNEQRRLLRLAFERADITLEQLWMRYFALGGDAGLAEVDAYLHSAMEMPALQRDMLAHAVNERLDELRPLLRAPYSRVMHAPVPETGPLAALVHLLDGTQNVPPDRVPQVAEEAGRALGMGITVYLVDYSQRRLVPIALSAEGEKRPALSIEGTLAGRAFRLVETVPTLSDGQPWLWVPLLDGTERLGVLGIALGHGNDPVDVTDPALLAQVRWISQLLGHMVTITSNYGDALDSARREQPRSAAAELVWGLLPPLTAATDRFFVAGMVEPSYTVGGDVFDYAMSEHSSCFAIFDAMGHSLNAGLLDAAALAAYRSSRRNGQSLFGQAQAIDETIDAHFGDDVFLTGVLAELDLASGRLRYISAGHPEPLLMRSGKIVKSLSGGRRTPFGLTAGELTVGEEMLEPGDWVVLHTDGITEARDQAGAFFGEDRLVDFLEREVAAGHPPPETARRVIQAVLTHQDGQLQDDATILLTRWLAAAS